MILLEFDLKLVFFSFKNGIIIQNKVQFVLIKKIIQFLWQPVKNRVKIVQGSMFI